MRWPRCPLVGPLCRAKRPVTTGSLALWGEEEDGNVNFHPSRQVFRLQNREGKLIFLGCCGIIRNGLMVSC